MQAGRHAVQHGVQAFTTARRMVCKVLTPRIDLGLGDMRPAEAVPGAEIHLQQGVVDVVTPPPAAQLASHGCTTLQGRAVHNARPTVLACRLPNAMSQTLGLAAVDGQVGAANAAPVGAEGPGVAPGDDLRGVGGCAHRERGLHQPTGWMTVSQASRPST